MSVHALTHPEPAALRSALLLAGAAAYLGGFLVAVEFALARLG